jgi:hypothetical protein
MRKAVGLFIIVLAFSSFALDQSLVSKIQAAMDNEVAGKMIALLKEAEDQDLPLEPLENKILEGLAKQKPAEAILGAILTRKSRMAGIVQDNQGSVPSNYNHLLYTVEKRETVLPAVPNGPDRIKARGRVKTVKPALQRKMDRLAPDKSLDGKQKRLETIQKKMEAKERALEKRERALKKRKRK